MTKTIYSIVDVVAEEPVTTFLANNSNQAKIAFQKLCKQNSEDGVQLHLYSVSDFFIDRYDENDVIADSKNNLQLIATYPEEIEKKIEKRMEDEVNEHIQ